MGRKTTSRSLDVGVADKLREWVLVEGETTVARGLGLSRHSLLRALAGLPVTPKVLARVYEWLPNVSAACPSVAGVQRVAQDLLQALQAFVEQPASLLCPGCTRGTGGAQGAPGAQGKVPSPG